MKRAALLVLALLGAAGSARAALPQGYFVWTRGTPDDPASRKIHRLTLPGRDEEIVLTSGEDVEPQISPDGKWVAYAKAKYGGGSDYHDFKLWRVYVVSIHGAGGGRREIKIDDDGAWPSWSQSGALFYNQADGTHSKIIRVEIDDRGRVTGKKTFAVTRDLFGGFAEVNEAAVAPDESWFAGRTRGNGTQNGVSAFTLNPPARLLLARAGDVGCMPRVAPNGAFGLIAGATEGIRWGHAPQVPNRKEDQLLIAARSPNHKAYHPGISTDGNWVLAAQGTDPDHNSGRYDISLYALDPVAMTVGDEQALTTSDFNGWPHLWVGPPGPPPPPHPEVGDFYASSYTVAPGESIVLTWNTFGADQVLLNGAQVAAEGTQEIKPASTMTLSLTASSSIAATGDTRTLEVTVNPTPVPVMVEHFAAQPDHIERGHSTTLDWRVRNATTLDLDGVRIGPVDGHEVSPLETTTYTLTAQGSGGPIQARVTVVVEAQRSGLLPDRGGFRCNFGGGNGGAGFATLVLLVAAALGRPRRRAV